MRWCRVWQLLVRTTSFLHYGSKSWTGCSGLRGWEVLSMMDVSLEDISPPSRTELTRLFSFPPCSTTPADHSIEYSRPYHRAVDVSQTFLFIPKDLSHLSRWTQLRTFLLTVFVNQSSLLLRWTSRYLYPGCPLVYWLLAEVNHRLLRLAAIYTKIVLFTPADKVLDDHPVFQLLLLQHLTNKFHFAAIQRVLKLYQLKLSSTNFTMML